MASLEEVYTMTLDMEGKKYCGLDLDWDYTNQSVTLSMDGNVFYFVTSYLNFRSHQLPPQSSGMSSMTRTKVRHPSLKGTTYDLYYCFWLWLWLVAYVMFLRDKQYLSIRFVWRDRSGLCLFFFE